MAKLSIEEIQNHNTADDCWLVIHGKVWDLTSFLDAHPGGSKILLMFAGQVATHEFDKIHPSDLPSRMLSPDLLKGEVDENLMPPAPELEAPKEEPVEQGEEVYKKPDLGEILNTYDFEAVAKHEMQKEGWNYYSSAADDEITLRENNLSFQRIYIKPRVCVDVSNIDLLTKTNLTRGRSEKKLSLPLYFTATALGKLADPEGEKAIVRAAYKCNVPYMIPTLASCSVDEILEAAHPDQVLWSQIYVNPNRQITYDYINKMETNGVSAIFITVDAPQLGNREKDIRTKYTKQEAAVQAQENAGKRVENEGVARAISTFIDHGLTWDGIREIMKRTKLPVYLKGVQCVEDALLAKRMGCRGIVLSNHGGRQLDTCLPAIEILPEVMEALNKEKRGNIVSTILKAFGPEEQEFDVFVDGGARRGSDIFKAVAYGATTVGIGRPVLYALAGYGEQGIEHLVEIFKKELRMTMGLAGTPRIKDITNEYVLKKEWTVRNYLMEQVYEPLTPVKVTTRSKL
eukprot:maker-scaffold_9-snap-gene-9.2-mRNA-1 protein AED:0.00 eAED:0.00 QI:303/1/1/1/1/1/2/82/514